MVSAAAVEQLAQFAAKGRIGSEIALTCSDLRPEAESTVAVSWDCSPNERGTLAISGAGRLHVPRVGRRRIAVGAAPVSIRLTAGAEVAEILVNPRIVAPRAELRGPSRAILGRPLRLTWHSNAETCGLRLADGDRVDERHVGPAGAIDVTPRNLGELRVALDAIGRHARLSREGIATRALTIRIAPPPLRVVFDAPEKTAFVGDEAAFSWSVSGARGIRIEAVDRGEVFPVPPVGNLCAEAGCEPERFHLVATGADGREEVREFRLIPRVLDVSHLPAELNALNLPWE